MQRLTCVIEKNKTKQKNFVLINQLKLQKKKKSDIDKSAKNHKAREKSHAIEEQVGYSLYIF